MGECLILRRGGEGYELPVLNAGYPANVTVVEAAGAAATFQVEMTTPGKPAEHTYQWYLDGKAISGATGSSYTRTGLTAAATYSLYCTVTSKAGTVTSRMATLTVSSSKPAYTYTGSHQLVSEGAYSWKLKLLSSGTLRLSDLGNAAKMDLFLVGGGGGAANGGGGGGYTTTQRGVTVAKDTSYSIVVGAGGAADAEIGGTGGPSAALGYTAKGGAGGRNWAAYAGRGGDGGSGGGAYVGEGGSGTYGYGGSDGANGKRSGVSHPTLGEVGAASGQGTTTREFGEAAGALYAGGGAGGASSFATLGGEGGGGNRGKAGTANTGGGGGGQGGTATAQSGGSGIVILRNAR